MTDLERLRDAGRILDSMAVPTDGRVAYMTKGVFLMLGGNEWDWEQIPGDDSGTKIVGGDW